MLNERDGFEAKQLVSNKSSKDPNVISFIDNAGSKFIRKKCENFEEKISMQSVIHPFGEKISKMREFLDADIVHYHLIFNHFMSLFSFKKLSKMKPTVWTLHDPWALTGHCVHPIDCKGWLTGCYNCKHLSRYSPLKEDNAHAIWQIKKDLYKELNVHIVVASKWMLDMVKRSPLITNKQKVHLIPFGIDLDLFKKNIKREDLRKKIGLNNDDFVIMFRQDDQQWKGLKYIKNMLESLDINNKKIVLLTVGKTGLLDSFKKKYRIIEHNWINNNQKLIDLYSISDLFLMPSIAESFGLMAVEAMACSLPIIVLDDTALKEVTYSPECGIVLKKGDTNNFVTAIENLIENPNECKRRGDLGRKITEKEYNIEEYNNKIIKLYESII
jgi:glycosyltransferase involved in cell wall biosynthesis